MMPTQEIMYCICMYCIYWLCFLLMCFFHVESPTVSVACPCPWTWTCPWPHPWPCSLPCHSPYPYPKSCPVPVPVLEGKNVTLICNATGTPPLSIKWTKGNDSTVLSSTSALTLYNVSRPGTPNETVQYRCTANGYGDPASAVVTVQVYCKYIFQFILLVKSECSVWSYDILV